MDAVEVEIGEDRTEVVMRRGVPRAAPARLVLEPLGGRTPATAPVVASIEEARASRGLAGQATAGRSPTR